MLRAWQKTLKYSLRVLGSSEISNTVSQLNISPMVVRRTALSPSPKQPLLALMDLREQCLPRGLIRLVPLCEHEPFHDGSENDDGVQQSALPVH